MGPPKEEGFTVTLAVEAPLAPLKEIGHVLALPALGKSKGVDARKVGDVVMEKGVDHLQKKKKVEVEPTRERAMHPIHNPASHESAPCASREEVGVVFKGPSYGSLSCLPCQPKEKLG